MIELAKIYWLQVYQQMLNYLDRNKGIKVWVNQVYWTTELDHDFWEDSWIALMDKWMTFGIIESTVQSLEL